MLSALSGYSIHQTLKLQKCGGLDGEKSVAQLISEGLGQQSPESLPPPDIPANQSVQQSQQIREHRDALKSSSFLLPRRGHAHQWLRLIGKLQEIQMQRFNKEPSGVWARLSNILEISTRRKSRTLTIQKEQRGEKVPILRSPRPQLRLLGSP